MESHPRVCASAYCATGLIGACLYEIDLPRRGQEIPQDRDPKR
jgi:hypothetical protein